MRRQTRPRFLASLLLVALPYLPACRSDPQTSKQESAVEGIPVGKVKPTPIPTFLDPQDADKIEARFAQLVSQRHPPGTTNVKRAVFLKPHACLQARFSIADDLPQKLKIGLFANAQSYDAWVRISSDTVPSTPDPANSTLGFSIKVLDVPGKKILLEEKDALTHDFLLQNHHVFFVDTAKDFMEFTEAIFTQKFAEYLSQHPKTGIILDEMKKRVGNVLATSYGSTTPYAYGPNSFVKYALRPCAERPQEQPSSAPNYLRQRLIRDLSEGEGCFHFMIQLRQGNETEMPLDQATVNWDEAQSPMVTAATLQIPKQELPPQDFVCEDYSFNTWHALPEHQPVGSINEARGIIYSRMSKDRRTRNNKPIVEPQSEIQ